MYKFLIVILALLVSLLLIPLLFNVASFMNVKNFWGETSDWFVLYGGILGGLIGGFFTYLAVLLTLRQNEQMKKKEVEPQIDILHKNVDFLGNKKGIESGGIVVEIINIGGSLAKNLKCTLSLPTIEDEIKKIKEFKVENKIVFEDLERDHEKKVWSFEEFENDTKQRLYRKYIHKEYSSTFIGHCMPLKFDSSAKASYKMDSSLTVLIQHYLSAFINGSFEGEKELIKFHLNISYNTEEVEGGSEIFELSFDWVGIDVNIHTGQNIFQCILKSRKL